MTLAISTGDSINSECSGLPAVVKFLREEGNRIDTAAEISIAGCMNFQAIITAQSLRQYKITRGHDLVKSYMNDSHLHL